MFFDLYLKFTVCKTKRRLHFCRRRTLGEEESEVAVPFWKCCDLFAGSAAIAAASMLPSLANAQDRKRLGIVGMVKPVRRPGTLEEILPFLPPGVGMIPVYVGITQGTENEFQAVLPAYEKEVALLAAQRCDIMSVEGGPVFLAAGLARETALVKGWEKTYGIPIFTAT